MQIQSITILLLISSVISACANTQLPFVQSQELTIYSKKGNIASQFDTTYMHVCELSNCSNESSKTKISHLDEKYSIESLLADQGLIRKKPFMVMYFEWAKATLNDRESKRLIKNLKTIEENYPLLFKAKWKIYGYTDKSKSGGLVPNKPLSLDRAKNIAELIKKNYGNKIILNVFSKHGCCFSQPVQERNPMDRRVEIYY